MGRAKAVVTVLAGVGFLVTAIPFWGDIDFIGPRALLAGLALLLLGVAYLLPTKAERSVARTAGADTAPDQVTPDQPEAATPGRDAMPEPREESGLWPLALRSELEQLM